MVFFLENNYYLGYITVARSEINKKARIAVLKYYKTVSKKTKIENQRKKQQGKDLVTDKYCGLIVKTDSNFFKYDNYYTYPDSLLTVPLP